MRLRDRVRENPPAEINARIDAETEADIHDYAARAPRRSGHGSTSSTANGTSRRYWRRMRPPSRWPVLDSSVTRDRRWLLLPGIVLPFLIQHAFQRWYPPIEVIRRLGVRARREIDGERVALKALRGDFGHMEEGRTPQERAQLALSAAGG